MQHEMQHEISEDDTAPAHHRGIYTFKIPDHSNARRDYNISILSPDYDFKSNLSSNSIKLRTVKQCRPSLSSNCTIGIDL